MRSWILAACAAPMVFVAVTEPALAATCAPAALTKVVTRAVGPDIAPGSFRAQPVVLYRKGAGLLRIEEAADPAQKLHLMTVVAAPDIWSVNRFDGTGRHMVDPGPSYDVHAPILTGSGVPAKFSELEFGCEAAFAKGRGYEAGSRLIEGRTARIFAMTEGRDRLEILLSARDEPVEVAYYQGERARLTIRYDLFQSGLPDDPALFVRPEGVSYQPGN